MAIVQSYGTIENITPPWYSNIQRRTIRLYDQLNYEYATLYRIQPNVRTCVDFLARNIAQLGIHQFLRVSDTDRVRLTDFGMTRLIRQPLPPKYKVTRYRMIESVVSDLGIYFSAYLLKIRDPETGKPVGLLRIPAPYMEPIGGLVVKSYKLRVGGYSQDLDPDDIVHFRGYNPENPIDGLSQLETLRRVLAEEDSSGKYREEMWQNRARMEGFIQRPREAPEWSPTARQRFLSEFNDLYAGEGQGGKTAVLEEGMTWVNASFSAREAEYLGARKLTREECARAYHIPLTMVGILDNATLTNIREQHQQLYQDSLGPPLKMLEEDFDLQLLPEFDDEVEDISLVYTEFNIMEKLAGDFEEQIKALQSAIGRPWMTPDEGRGRLNMRALGGDAGLLATPLNVLIGGQASPRDSAPKGGQHSRKRLSGMQAKRVDSHAPQMRGAYELKWVEVLTGYFSRQERAILSRVNPALEAAGKGDLGGGVWWDAERWNRELGEDLLKLNLLTAMAWANLLFEKLDSYPRDMEAFEARLIPYLKEHSRIQAENINQTTADEIEAALRYPDPLDSIKEFFKKLTRRAIQEAISAVTNASSFGSTVAAVTRGLSKKTWHVNSGNPRESHAALDGVSVGIRDNFPNGMRWPGDPSGGADEVAGCQCSVEFT